MAQLYNSGIGILADGTISWATSPIVALIVDSGQVFDITDVFVSDVVADEVTNATGTGYARKTLTGKTVTVDQVNDRVVFDATDVTYTAVETKTMRGRATVEQKQFIGVVSQSGGRAGIARTDSDLDNILRG